MAASPEAIIQVKDLKGSTETALIKPVALLTDQEHQKLLEQYKQQQEQLQEQIAVLQKEKEQLNKALEDLKLEAITRQEISLKFEQQHEANIKTLTQQLEQLTSEARRFKTLIDTLTAQSIQQQKEKELYQAQQKKIEELSDVIRALRQAITKTQQETQIFEIAHAAALELLTSQIIAFEQVKKHTQSTLDALVVQIANHKDIVTAFPETQTALEKLKQSLALLKQQQTQNKIQSQELQKQQEADIESLKQQIKHREIEATSPQAESERLTIQIETQEKLLIAFQPILTQQAIDTLKKEETSLTQALAQKQESHSTQYTEQEATITKLKEQALQQKTDNQKQAQERENEIRHLSQQILVLQETLKCHKKELTTLTLQGTSHQADETEYQKAQEALGKLKVELKYVKQAQERAKEEYLEQQREQDETTKDLQEQLSKSTKLVDLQKEEISKLKEQWEQTQKVVQTGQSKGLDIVQLRLTQTTLEKTVQAEHEQVQKLKEDYQAAEVHYVLQQKAMAALKKELTELEQPKDSKIQVEDLSTLKAELELLTREAEQQEKIDEEQAEQCRLKKTHLTKQKEELREAQHKAELKHLSKMVELQKNRQDNQQKTEFEYIQQQMQMLELMQSTPKPQTQIAVSVVNRDRISQAKPDPSKVYNEISALREQWFTRILNSVTETLNPNTQQREWQLSLDRKVESDRESREKRLILKNHYLSDYYYFFQLKFYDTLLACKAFHLSFTNLDANEETRIIEALVKNIPSGEAVLKCLNTCSNSLQKKAALDRAVALLKLDSEAIEILARQLALSQLYSLPQLLSPQKVGYFQKNWEALSKIKEDLFDDIPSELQNLLEEQCQKLLITVFLDKLNDQHLETLLEILLKPYYLGPDIRTKIIEERYAVLFSQNSPILFSPNAVYGQPQAPFVVQPILATLIPSIEFQPLLIPAIMPALENKNDNTNSAETEILQKKIAALTQKLEESRKDKCCTVM